MPPKRVRVDTLLPGGEEQTANPAAAGFGTFANLPVDAMEGDGTTNNMEFTAGDGGAVPFPPSPTGAANVGPETTGTANTNGATAAPAASTVNDTEGPIDRARNPFLWKVPRGAPPVYPNNAPAHLGSQRPNTVMTPDQICYGVDEGQKKDILANPDKYSAIVIHCGGPNFWELHPNVIADIEHFLDSFDGFTHPNPMVIAPETVNGRKITKGPDFMGPYVVFVAGYAQGLMAYIQYQGAINISADLTISAYSLYNNTGNWILSTLASPALNHNVYDPKLTLQEIKDKVSTNTIVQKAVEKATGLQGNLLKEAVKDWLRSFDIVFTPGTAADPAGTQIGILYAKPITTDPAKHAKIVAALESMLVRVNSMRIAIGRRKPHCHLCKMATHFMDACPFPTTAGWKGYEAQETPLPNGEDNPTAEESSASTGNARGNKRTRGGWMKVDNKKGRKF